MMSQTDDHNLYLYFPQKVKFENLHRVPSKLKQASHRKSRSISEATHYAFPTTQQAESDPVP
jgi:hypothetical protein